MAPFINDLDLICDVTGSLFGFSFLDNYSSMVQYISKFIGSADLLRRLGAGLCTTTGNILWDGFINDIDLLFNVTTPHGTFFTFLSNNSSTIPDVLNILITILPVYGRVNKKNFALWPLAIFLVYIVKQHIIHSTIYH